MKKILFDKMTIKLHFFLEKRAIFRDFHCKYKRQARPSFIHKTKGCGIFTAFLVIYNHSLTNDFPDNECFEHLR